MRPRALRLVCALALVYTNYFGWAMLGCLALDFAVQRRPWSVRTVLPVAVAGGHVGVEHGSDGAVDVERHDGGFEQNDGCGGQRQRRARTLA